MDPRTHSSQKLAVSESLYRIRVGEIPCAARIRESIHALYLVLEFCLPRSIKIP